MDSSSLSNILGLLRMLRNQGMASPYDILRQAFGENLGDEAVMKMAICVIEEVTLAREVISRSELAEEAQMGLFQTLNSLQSAFSSSGLRNQLQSNVTNVEGAISNFVILLSTAGLRTQSEPPQEAVDLADEVDAILKLFDDEEIDPVLRDVAKRHLVTLSTLLRHIPIFGLEAAMATYAEMIIRLRKVNVSSSETARSKVASIFEKIETWTHRFETIDKAWNTGTIWLGKAKGVAGLLGHIT